MRSAVSFFSVSGNASRFRFFMASLSQNAAKSIFMLDVLCENDDSHYQYLFLFKSFLMLFAGLSKTAVPDALTISIVSATVS